jgi:hypothetical protein
VFQDQAVRVISRIAPALLPGSTLHRLALAAAAAGHYADAEQAFAAAARRYQQEWRVESLARLRVHQQMVRARATGEPEREAEMMLSIVRSLNKLDRLESLASPHELVDARAVFSGWLSESSDRSLETLPEVAAELRTVAAA